MNIFLYHIINLNPSTPSQTRQINPILYELLEFDMFFELRSRQFIQRGTCLVTIVTEVESLWEVSYEDLEDIHSLVASMLHILE